MHLFLFVHPEFSCLSVQCAALRQLIASVRPHPLLFPDISPAMYHLKMVNNRVNVISGSVCSFSSRLFSMIFPFKPSNTPDHVE